MPSKQVDKRAGQPAGAGRSRERSSTRRGRCQDSPVPSESERATRSDRASLLAIAEHGAVPIDLLAALRRCSLDEARSWVETGKARKWLRTTSYPAEEFEWVLPLIRGVKLAGRQWLRRERPSSLHLEHRRRIIEARLLLREEKPGWRWVSECEFRNRPDSPWVPDGVLERGKKGWVVEVEMHGKDDAEVLHRRLEELAEKYAGVIYFCAPGTRGALEELKKSGRFPTLQVRPLPGEAFGRRRGRYEPPRAARRVLRLLSEEGMVAEDHLGPLLGWRKSKVKKVLAALEEESCICRAAEVNGEQGWVSCTERGSARSGTGLPHFHISGRVGLAKRMRLTAVRLDLEGRCGGTAWRSHRMLAKDQGSRSGVPHGAIRIDGESCAVLILDPTPTRAPLARRLAALRERYGRVLCYRVDNRVEWMADFAGFAEEHALTKVELRDLPKRHLLRLTGDGKGGLDSEAELSFVRLALEEEKPDWVWIVPDRKARGGDEEPVPDGILSDGEQRYAVEVEVSVLPARELKERLKGLCRAYDGVIYFCGLPDYRRLRRLERQGAFPKLDARLTPGAMRFRVFGPVVRDAYEPSPEAIRALRLINEEGVVAVAQLHRALGWTVERLAEVMAELLDNKCIRRGFEVKRDGGWVWCNYRGEARAETGLVPPRVTRATGRNGLRRRFVLMEVRLDALARWPEARWRTGREVRRDYNLPSSGVPTAVIERGGLRYAVLVLESRCYWKTTVGLLEQWKHEYAGVVVYRTSILIPWMRALVRKHQLDHVEIRDLPKPKTGPYRSLDDEWRSGHEPFEPTGLERRLLTLTSLEGLLSLQQLPRALGCSEEEAERTVISLEERNCLQRHYEEEWPGGWVMCNGRGTTMAATGLARAKLPKLEALEQRFQLMEIRLSRGAPLSAATWKTRRELAHGLKAHAHVAHAAMRRDGGWRAVAVYFRQFRTSDTRVSLERWSAEFDGVTCYCRAHEVEVFRRFVDRHGLTAVEVEAIPRSPDHEARARQEAFEAELLRREEERAAREHPKVMARRAVAAAIRGGRLVKPDVCQNGCHIEKPGDLDAHHRNYDEPLNVEWLCITCHVAANAALEARS